MGVKLVRIDDRLIHGQVCSTWIGDYGIEQVLIINDKVSKDPVQKSVVGLAAPAGVRVLVFGVDQFIITSPLSIYRSIKEESNKEGYFAVIYNINRCIKSSKWGIRNSKGKCWRNEIQRN